MIKLKHTLRELEYGAQLFGDTESPSFYKASSIKSYGDFLKRIGVDTERNTQEEERLFNTITMYLKGADNIDDLSPLRELFALKSKYPQLLDPTTATTIPNKNYVYRGATIPTSDLVELVKAAKVDWSDFDVSDFLPVSVNGKTVSSRSTRGALSFTFSRLIGETFATGADKVQLSSFNLAERYPVMLKCKTSDLSDKLLFTPAFLDSISGYGEYETFYFGNDIPCDTIEIAPPMAFVNLGSPSELEDKFEDDLPPILWDFLQATNYI